MPRLLAKRLFFICSPERQNVIKNIRLDIQCLYNIYAFLWVHKPFIVRIVNILLDIVMYEQDMQQEDSHIQNRQKIQIRGKKEEE